MFTTILPKVTLKKMEDNNSSAFQYPSGMLDRDQRTTTSLSVFSKKNFHHQNQTPMEHLNNLHQQNKFNHSHRMMKDNKETVWDLHIFETYRLRTKFSVTLHIIAWIIFFAINFTYSNAKPLPSTEPIFDICNVTELNVRSTNYSMETLKSVLYRYQNITGISDEYVSQWDHYSDTMAHKKVADLFDGTDLMQFNNTLFDMHKRLTSIKKRLYFHICQHKDERFMSHTIHNMNLNGTKNNEITHLFEEINQYTDSSIVQIKDAFTRLKLESNFPKSEENCELFTNTHVASEVITMKQLNGTLEFMTNFFNYVQQTFCLQK